MLFHSSTSSDADSLAHSPKVSQFWCSLKTNDFLRTCKSIGNALINTLNTNREPQVVWKRDHQGHSYLEVYNPTTETYWYFRSEQDARVWLEQRYYIKASE